MIKPHTCVLFYWWLVRALAWIRTIVFVNDTWFSLLASAFFFSETQYRLFFLGNSSYHSLTICIAQSFLWLNGTTQISQSTHSPLPAQVLKPYPMCIFEDWADKSSRLIKSSQAPRCRREHRLPLKTQCLLNPKKFTSTEVEPRTWRATEAHVTARLQALLIFSPIQPFSLTFSLSTTGTLRALNICSVFRIEFLEL